MTTCPFANTMASKGMFTRVLSIQGPGFGRSNQRPDVHTGASCDLVLFSNCHTRTMKLNNSVSNLV